MNGAVSSFKATTRADKNYRSAIDIIGSKGRIIVKGVSLNTFNKFKDTQFYKVNINPIGTSAIDCEIKEWKDCNNLTYITQKELVKSLDKTTKR